MVMKMQQNHTNLSPGENEIETEGKRELTQKIHNATLKKFYESKIASLSAHDMPPYLLRMMCQDVPAKECNLDSRWGRKWFVQKCLRFYQGKIREIDRSENKGFFGLFS